MYIWSRFFCLDFMFWIGNFLLSFGFRIYNIYKIYYMFYLVLKNWFYFYILKEEFVCIFKGFNLYNFLIKVENLLYILMYVYE